MAATPTSADLSGLEAMLLEHGQGHAWNVLVHLCEHSQQRLSRQLENVDWPQLRRVFHEHHAGPDATSLARSVADPYATLVLEPVRNLVRLPSSSNDHDWIEARRRGADHLASGRVAAVMVAGGQGTRLGFDGPKGMFPVGPLSNSSLYQWSSEQVLYRSRKHGQSIPFIIMTSEATHAATLKFFAEHNDFGLKSEDVWFICQGNLPAVDYETGEALFAGDDRLALSPDGHGGLLDALSRYGVWKRLCDRGIDTLAYHQVDNPLTPICDPAFIGWHLIRAADVSTKIARKRSPDERMGLVMEVNKVPQVVEYSDISEDIAGQVNSYGELRFWAGNTGMHVFNTDFLESIAHSSQPLPLHAAHKVVPFWEDGAMLTPRSPNAVKFERFIFDVIPRASNALFVEADRDVEFQPIKNRFGNDSPATCQAALLRRHRNWLENAGIRVSEGVPVEISPQVAQEAADLKHLLPEGTTITEPLVVSRRR